MSEYQLYSGFRDKKEIKSVNISTGNRSLTSSAICSNLTKIERAADNYFTF